MIRIKDKNFCLVFGTTPSKNVKSDTKMIENIIDHIKFKQDKVKKYVEFPGVLEQIKTDDANFEVSISNTCERLKLYHRNSLYKRTFQNIVGKTIGVIFINSTCLNLPHQIETLEKRREIASRRMRNMWEVDTLDIVNDPTKEEVKEKFNWLIA